MVVEVAREVGAAVFSAVAVFVGGRRCGRRYGVASAAAIAKAILLLLNPKFIEKAPWRLKRLNGCKKSICRHRTQRL